MIANLTQRSVTARLGWGVVAGLLAWTVPQVRADQVIADNLIVQGAVCMGIWGLPCVSGEPFGDLNILSKSEYTIFRFDDTDTDPSVSTHDWEIWANDYSENMFRVSDLTSGTSPFTIQGGAPNNSLYVASNGNVGLGTNIPVVDLHIVTGVTPVIRMEQDASGGYPPTVWDIASDERGFWIYDGIHGTYPLKIDPNGNVGVGIWVPTAKLHAYENTNANTFILAENAGTGLSSAGVLRAKSNAATVNFQAHGSGRTLSRFGQVLASWAEFLQVDGNGLIIGTNGARPLILGTAAQNRIFISSAGNVGFGGLTTPTHPIQHANGARLTAGGVWTHASSRELKDKIHALTASEAAQTLAGLQPVHYQYKAEPGESYLGFVAEDVPDAVATADRKGLNPMDIVAVLTKVVQEQQGMLAEQQEAMQEQQRMLAEQQHIIEHLNRKVTLLGP